MKTCQADPKASIATLSTSSTIKSIEIKAAPIIKHSPQDQLAKEKEITSLEKSSWISWKQPKESP